MGHHAAGLVVPVNHRRTRCWLGVRIGAGPCPDVKTCSWGQNKQRPCSNHRQTWGLWGRPPDRGGPFPGGSMRGAGEPSCGYPTCLSALSTPLPMLLPSASGALPGRAPDGSPPAHPARAPSQGSASGCPPWVHSPSSAVSIQVCVLRGPHPLRDPHRPPGCGSCPVSSLCPHRGPVPSPSLSHVGQFKLNFSLTDTFSVGRTRPAGVWRHRPGHHHGCGGWGTGCSGQPSPGEGSSSQRPVSPSLQSGGGAPAPTADGAAVPWASGRPAPTTTARQAGARLLWSANEDWTR